MAWFYPDAPSNVKFELDLICVIGSVAILIEVTSDGGKNTNKIKKFVDHCNALKNSTTPVKEIFKRFSGIPEDQLHRFEGVTQWRFLYVGYTDDIRDSKLIPGKYSYLTEDLQIFDKYTWEYFRQLTELIGGYAKHEILASLNISAEQSGEQSPPVLKEFLKIPHRYISPKTPAANIYLIKFSPDELLKLARVTRYEGLPLAIGTSESGASYQRMLSKEKIRNIRSFINKNELNAFPTSLTIVLNPGWQEVSTADGPQLKIPGGYGSLEIVDGQHRLFAYADPEINQSRRDDSCLVVTALHFGNTTGAEVGTIAAKIFVEINTNHTKLKKSHVDLLSYDVLEKRDHRSIAGKILKTFADAPKNKTLGKLFQISDFERQNRFGQTPIPITVVVGELARAVPKFIYLMDKANDGDEEFIKKFNAAFERNNGSRVYSGGKFKFLTTETAKLMERYFSAIKGVFPGDWGNGNSYLMSAKYLAACIRLVSDFVEDGKNTIEIQIELSKIRGYLQTRYHPNLSIEDSTSPLFVASTVAGITGPPNKRDANVENVYKILTAYRGA